MLACHSNHVTTINKMIHYPLWSCVVDLHESQSDLLFRKKKKENTRNLFLEQLMQNRC